MTGLEAAFGGLTLLSGAVTTYVGLKFEPLKEANKDTQEAMKLARTEHDKTVADLRVEFDKRIAGLHNDTKDYHEKMERRLADVEKSYISRAELNNTIRDLRDGFEKGITRIENAVTGMAGKIEALTNRIAKVEAAP